MPKKRIYNPSTGKYYAIRQKTTSNGKKGQILGAFKIKKNTAKTIKKKYSTSIKRLGST